MLQTLTTSHSTSRYCHPIQMLEQVSDRQESGYLLLSDGEVDWRFYFHDRQLIYASHSIKPSERLARHLRRLSAEHETLTAEVCHQICQSLANYWLNDFSQFPDYQAIIWLIDQYYLPPEAATILVQRLTQEVLEAYVLLPSVFYKKWFPFTTELPILSQLNLKVYIRQCRQRLRVWQTLKTHLYSPYQRPYFFLNAYAQEHLSSEQQRRFSKLFKGLNLYEIAANLNKDELLIARRIYPLIVNQAVVLREPSSPFNKLPRFSQFQPTASDELLIEPDQHSSLSQLCHPQISHGAKYKIACVNVHLILLKEIEHFLSGNSSEIFLINDPVKTLQEIKSLQPDLILIDTASSNLDSYHFCSHLRKIPLFKATPIILLTNNKGIVNRAKARLAGVTDYLSKPLTQVDLLKVIFQYLS